MHDAVRSSCPQAPAQPDDKTRAELEELGETMNAMKKMSIQEIMRQDPKFIERRGDAGPARRPALVPFASKRG